MRKKKKSLVKKIMTRLIGEAILGSIVLLLYLHRNLIIAAIKGEELPKAPKGCPVYNKDT